MADEKVSTDQLRERFDGDVDRFSNEMTGQQTIVDAPLTLHAVENILFKMQPEARSLCDIGCGGGNFSLRIARKLPRIAVTLLDLSEPMLRRASQRLQAEGFQVAATVHEDVRNVRFEPESFDVVVASASLHHLRTQAEWRNVFRNVFEALRPDGSFWICDIIKHENDAVEEFQRERYADFLVELQDGAFQERIFEMIRECDTPETIDFQMRTLHDVGFRKIDIVHKNMLFFVAVARK